MGMCENCKYRLFLANAYDMHIDSNDCDKVNTHFCEKMQKPDTTVIIDAGCTDKTIYHKGYKDGVKSVEVVRCKDCKYCLETSASSTKIACSKGVNWRAVEPNHYCSYGERKDHEASQDYGGQGSDRYLPGIQAGGWEGIRGKV